MYDENSLTIAFGDNEIIYQCNSLQCIKLALELLAYWTPLIPRRFWSAIDDLWPVLIIPLMSNHSSFLGEHSLVRPEMNIEHASMSGTLEAPSTRELRYRDKIMYNWMLLKLSLHHDCSAIDCSAVSITLAIDQCGSISIWFFLIKYYTRVKFMCKRISTIRNSKFIQCKKWRLSGHRWLGCRCTGGWKCAQQPVNCISSALVNWSVRSFWGGLW